MPIDPNSLPQDANALRKIVLDLAEQLDRAFAEQHKYASLLRELLEAQRNRKSEQLSKEQLALFEAGWQARNPEDEPEPARTTTISATMRKAARNPRKRQTGNGADASLWLGI
jgi:hypothetical protein